MRNLVCGLALALALADADAAPCPAPCPGVVTITAPEDAYLIELESDGDSAAAPPFPVLLGMRAPAVARVLTAAYAAAGLDREPARGWVRRARLAGLVPLLTVRTGRNSRWQDDGPAVTHGTAVEVRATWHLDRLVFDGRELQVASIEAGRRRERVQLASRVIRTYFAWRRTAAAAAAHPAASWRAEQAAAELDALTDGWFSEELVGVRRTPSGSRTP